MLFELDDFDDVPRARQAYAQAKSGTVGNFSVGFLRQEWRELDPAQHDGAREEITRARLDEVSMTIAGAVPGTELLDVRDSRGAGPRRLTGQRRPRPETKVDRALRSVERMRAALGSYGSRFGRGMTEGHRQALEQAALADMQALSPSELLEFGRRSGRLGSPTGRR